VPILAGQIVLASDTAPPAATRCRAYSSAGVPGTTNGATTLVPLGAETYDTAGMHSTVINTSRITVPVSGAYLIIAQIAWATNASGRRGIFVRKNAGGNGGAGTQIMVTSQAASPMSGTTISVQDVLELASGDHVEMWAYQSSGVALDVSSGETNTFLTVILQAS